MTVDLMIVLNDEFCDVVRGWKYHGVFAMVGKVRPF